MKARPLELDDLWDIRPMIRRGWWYAEPRRLSFRWFRLKPGIPRSRWGFHDEVDLELLDYQPRAAYGPSRVELEYQLLLHATAAGLPIVAAHARAPVAITEGLQ